MRQAFIQWNCGRKLYAIAKVSTAGLLQDTQHKCHWDLLPPKMELQLARNTKNAHAAHTPVCMNMQYMTSRAAALLIRESKGLLVARQQPGPVPSHLLTTTKNLSDCVLAAIRAWDKGAEGMGRGEKGHGEGKFRRNRGMPQARERRHTTNSLQALTAGAVTRSKHPPCLQVRSG